MITRLVNASIHTLSHTRVSLLLPLMLVESSYSIETLALKESSPHEQIIFLWTSKKNAGKEQTIKIVLQDEFFAESKETEASNKRIIHETHYGKERTERINNRHCPTKQSLR